MKFSLTSHKYQKLGGTLKYFMYLWASVLKNKHKTANMENRSLVTIAGHSKEKILYLLEMAREFVVLALVLKQQLTVWVQK